MTLYVQPSQYLLDHLHVIERRYVHVHLSVPVDCYLPTMQQKGWITQYQQEMNSNRTMGGRGMSNNIGGFTNAIWAQTFR